MTEIGAFDAKTHFSQLLARTERGEQFTITHRGRAVARLIPMEGAPDIQRAQAAYARMRARAATLEGPSTFDWNEWKQFRDEGRR